MLHEVVRMHIQTRIEASRLSAKCKCGQNWLYELNLMDSCDYYEGIIQTRKPSYIYLMSHVTIPELIQPELATNKSSILKTFKVIPVVLVIL